MGSVENNAETLAQPAVGEAYRPPRKELQSPLNQESGLARTTAHLALNNYTPMETALVAQRTRCYAQHRDTTLLHTRPGIATVVAPGTSEAATAPVPAKVGDSMGLPIDDTALCPTWLLLPSALALVAGETDSPVDLAAI